MKCFERRIRPNLEILQNENSKKIWLVIKPSLNDKKWSPKFKNELWWLKLTRITKQVLRIKFKYLYLLFAPYAILHLIRLNLKERNFSKNIRNKFCKKLKILKKLKVHSECSQSAVTLSAIVIMWNTSWIW